MEKRTRKVILLVAGTAAVVAGCVMIFLGLVSDKVDTGIVTEEAEMIGSMMGVQENGKMSMLALVDSEEEAKEIAELYGMEFERYSYGVATYWTEKNPQELIKMGKEKGYPSISVNHEVSID